MTKLNDSIHRINPSLLPKKSGVKNQEDNDKLLENKEVSPSPKQVLNLENFNQINKANFVAKVMNQSIFSNFSSSFMKLSLDTSSFDQPSVKINQHLAEIDLAKAEAESDVSLFDFEEVAKNVMAFVSTAILSAKSRDVGDENLEELFNQARSGVKQGIGEAIHILKDRGALTETIETGIDKSRELINSKIDDLYQQIFEPQEPAGTINKSAVTNENNISTSQSSDLSITTVEGDKITLSFNSIQDKSSVERYNVKGSPNNHQVEQASYSEQQFSYSIEGDLNENEEQALVNLINQVNALQHDFFKGDIEKAFIKANELAIEPSQIASFNLDLKQKSIISQKYTQVANNQDHAIEAKHKLIGQQLKPVIDFVEQFDQLQKSAEQLLSSEGNQITKFYDAIIEGGNAEDNLRKLTRWHSVIDKL
jgi:hypothetical protein